MGSSGRSGKSSMGSVRSTDMHWGSMGGLGSPMAVPPPFKSHQPPKILSLVREKVDLHKAESAWKPSVSMKYGRSGGSKDSGSSSAGPKDEEEIIRDVSIYTYLLTFDLAFTFTNSKC